MASISHKLSACAFTLGFVLAQTSTWDLLQTKLTPLAFRLCRTLLCRATDRRGQARGGDPSRGPASEAAGASTRGTCALRGRFWQCCSFLWCAALRFGRRELLLSLKSMCLLVLLAFELLIRLSVQVPFEQKLLWTLGALLVYLVCSNVPLYGITMSKRRCVIGLIVERRRFRYPNARASHYMTAGAVHPAESPPASPLTAFQFLAIGRAVF